MKRLIAFALALAVVFGVSFALYKPERIEAAAQETMDDEWVGYFFALEPFDGKVYATENGDDYDFGVPGVPVFVTITAFEPDDPDYEEGSEFNNSVGAAVSDEVVGSGMHITAAATRRAERSRSTRWDRRNCTNVMSTARLRGTTMPSARRPTARTYVTGHPAQT